MTNTQTDHDSTETHEEDASEAPVIEAPDEVLQDGSWGYKTAAYGESGIFHGFYEHTILQVPHGKSDKDDEPRIINRLSLVPPRIDEVEPTLELLDRLKRPATDIVIDRAYSHKGVKRWHDKLYERGINQCLDLRVDEHGFTDIDSTRWAAGWPHCPATPDELGEILKPGVNKPQEDLEEFYRRIDYRENYAFRRVSSPGHKGKAQWECPAHVGKIGCPLVQGTLQAALEAGVPIVDNPPSPDAPDFPKCCSQRTVVIEPEGQRKHMQKHYWGSKKWWNEWKKRPYVEGSYGNRKNGQTENIRRGQTRVSGIEKITIFHVLAAASYNLRMIRNWHERTGRGDANHPLLQPKQENHGFARLTKEQAAAIAELQRRDDR